MLKRCSIIKLMNRLDATTREQIISCLIEGCSIRSTVRMTGAAKKTVMRVLVEIGGVCANFQDKAFRKLNSKRIQVDELWAFCYCKEKTVTPEIAAKHEGAGNVWLWVAIDADTKIVPCWSRRPWAAICTHVYERSGAASEQPCATDKRRP